VEWIALVAAVAGGVLALVAAVIARAVALGTKRFSVEWVSEADELAREKFIAAASTLSTAEARVFRTNLDDLVDSALAAGSTAGSLDVEISKAVDDRVSDLLRRLRRVEAQIGAQPGLEAADQPGTGSAWQRSW
jgi:hypothetical protein